MASSSDTVQYIVDQAGLGRRLEFKKMFGEYALYVDSKVVALICDDQLFLKPTPEGLHFLGKVMEAPPYPGAKNHYLLASELDDPDRLNAVLQITAAALPEPKPKRAKVGKGSRPTVKGKKVSIVPPNNPLQRSGLDKVPGRGRGDVVLEQVFRARVLKRGWPAAERGC